MEPVTHFLAGACLSRAGFNRRAAYATLAMTLAAETPDIDVLWSVRGPIAGFQHHRGITHTLLGIPFEAALVVGIVWLVHRWRVSRGKTTAAPLRWGLLYCFSILALLSHLLLDWTNNYGIRPFFPFNPHWYALSISFIFEPLMFLALVAGLTAPPLFGLINSEVGAKKTTFRGRGWAISALLFIVALWGFRGFENLRAQQVAQTEDYDGAEVLRAFPNSYPLTPFRWHTVVQTPEFYQLATVDTLNGTAATSEADRFYYRPVETPATRAAKQSYGGRVFLDWAMFALVTDDGPDPDQPALTVVSFRDLRFMYNTLIFSGRQKTPLQVKVWVDAGGRVVRTAMDGKVQR